VRRFAVLTCLLAVTSFVAKAQDAQAIWIDVPFVQQPREGCGAASLSMVMQYWAHQLTQPVSQDSDLETIQRAIYSPREHGALASSMQQYLRQHGYQAFTLSGRWNDFENELRKGRPLIVALRPEGQRALHYVVVVGVDAGRGLVMMNDPAERKLLSEERAAFEKEWSATGNWTLLAVPVSPSH
jgi:ABC-type bacteriocin/lantibiotic exporter with double-glycine peptidase domain